MWPAKKRMPSNIWHLLIAVMITIPMVMFAGTGTAETPISWLPSNYKEKVSLPQIDRACWVEESDVIVFSMKHYRINGIFSMTKTGEVTKWLRKNDNNVWHGQPTISHDSKKIAYISGRAHKEWTLHLMDLDGKNDVRLTDASYYASNPCFSHDNKSIYFVRSKSWGSSVPFGRSTFHESDIYAVDIASGKVLPITRQNFSKLTDIQAMPDGTRLIFNRFPASPTTNGLLNGPPSYSQTTYTLWMLYLDDPLKVEPINPVISAAINSESPGCGWLHYPVISRDGRSLLATCNVFASAPTGTAINIINMETGVASQVIRIGTTQLIPQSISIMAGQVLFTHDLNYPLKGYMPASNLWICNIDGTNLRNFALDFRRIMDGNAPYKYGKSPNDGQ